VDLLIVPNMSMRACEGNDFKNVTIEGRFMQNQEHKTPNLDSSECTHELSAFRRAVRDLTSRKADSGAEHASEQQGGKSRNQINGLDKTSVEQECKQHPRRGKERRSAAGELTSKSRGRALCTSTRATTGSTDWMTVRISTSSARTPSSRPKSLLSVILSTDTAERTKREGKEGCFSTKDESLMHPCDVRASVLCVRMKIL
jgi:hypothetical protein